MKQLLILFVLILNILVQSVTFAQEKSLLEQTNLPALSFRNIGPAFMSGRITDFAVNPNNYHQFYVAVACGGVWKTENSGITWKPVFDKYGSYSIGCLALDSKNPNVLWVGSGENNSQRSVAWGDGVYKSTDGGKSFTNMGLKNAEHIGRIAIDPHNSNIVYVAAQGPLWGPGGDRGLYKTTDGGQNWEKILDISENTGINDIIIDPTNPDNLIASSYQRRRHVWTLINGGPESNIYKSTDGGKTWKKITSGIPEADKGRIGLAYAPTNPNIVYAIIEAQKDAGGFFKSTDGGESWERTNAYKTVSAQYYNEIVVDPVNPDKVFVLDTRTTYTLDGGKTFKRLGGAHRHVDDHAIWVNPDNTDHLLIGGDGGVYETFDFGANWQFKANLPVTQFYRVSVDNSKPFYYVYGGTQDNNSQGGPSQTTNTSGICNEDWFVTQGGDGFESAIDPEDPNIVYSQSQYGWLIRFNRKTGEKTGIKPMEKKGEAPFRWNWDAPLLISPHKNTRLYFAANILFKSEDRGNSWQAISPDLTRQLNRNQLKVMGKIWSVDAVAKNASTSVYGNIVSLDESPLVEGLIYIGTDDGLIQITEDGGQNWRKAKLPNIPEYAYVSDVLASKHDENTVYATFSNHKMADFTPYVLKSTDRGKTWKSISNNLEAPEVAWSIAEDHVDKNLLFLGTEYGLYTSIDGGNNWTKLTNGLPTIAIRDIDIQERENDLALASFGRGFYILDDYSPLRQINTDILDKEAWIFDIKDARMFIQTSRFAYGAKGSQGASYFAAPNPPYGACFTYYLKDDIKTKEQIRTEKEKKAIKNNEDVYYPNFEELREEDLEQAPFLVFEISDASGQVIRRLKAPATKGIQRIYWDFKYASVSPIRPNRKNKNEGGMMALPGTYYVTLLKNENDIMAKIAGPVAFNCKWLEDRSFSETQQKSYIAFMKEYQELQRQFAAVADLSRNLHKQIKLIKDAIRLSDVNQNTLLVEARDIERQNQDIQLILFGDQSIASRNGAVPQSVQSRLSAISWEVWQSTEIPTATHKMNLRIAKEEFEDAKGKLKQLLQVNIPEIEEKLEKANAPYTPGRFPELK